MNEKKKPGCLWRLVKFTFFTLMVLAVAGYFFCWRTPEFKLTPERIGWTLPPGVEVPLMPDGKYVDHEKAFELTYPEFYENPHKNGWRKVLLAVSPEYFRQETESFVRLANREAMPEDWEKWQADWAACYRKLNILPEQIGDFVPKDYEQEMERIIFRELLREAKTFAAANPDLQPLRKPVAGEEVDAFDVEYEMPTGDALNEAMQKAGLKSANDLSRLRDFRLSEDNREYFQQELGEFGELRMPHEMEYSYPAAVRHELETRAWRAEDYPGLAAWIASQSPFWDVVAEAVREEVFYPLPVGGGNPDATLLRAVARGLRMRAAMRHGAGDTAGAMTDVETIILMGRQLQRSPIVVTYLVGAVIENLGWRAVLTQFEDGMYSRKDLAFITKLMDTGHVTRDWWDFLPETKMIYYTHAQQPEWGMGMYTQTPDIWECYRHFYQVDDTDLFIGGLLARMPLNANRATDKVMALIRKIETSRSTDFLKAEVTAYNLNLQETPPWQHYLSMIPTSQRTDHYIMTLKQHFADIPSIICDQPYTRDRDALLRAGIACRLYRMDKGEFPETLDALVPEYLAAVPEDAHLPGEKIKYRVEEDRVVIYTVGYDKKDDGGLWNGMWNMEEYQWMKNVGEEEYINKEDTILCLKK